ncbi:MAG: hypothetical protein HGB10_08295 [Coriobacteriia bacterium]|nr:hypothetical protein [Coriobacteriia bacterium]
MDFGSVLREAWVTVRRSRTMGSLAGISVAGGFIYALLVGVALVPLLILPQATLSLSMASSTAGADAPEIDAFVATITDGAATVIAEAGPAIVAGLLLIFALWIGLGILDVAAMGGMIAEAASPRSSRTLARLDDGFRVWWRVAALYALGALPSLVSMLVMGLVVLFTTTIPLSRGELPSPAATIAGQLLMVPLQPLTAVASVLLGLLVNIAVRSAVLEDLGWRAALRRGFELVRRNLESVAVIYLLSTLIVASVLVAAAIVFGIVSSALVVLVGALVAVLGSMTTAGVVAAILGVAVAIMMLVVYALLVAWRSAVFTVLWKRIALGDRPHSTDQRVAESLLEGSHT